MKKEEKRNVTKSENHEHATTAQRTQNDDDRDINDINNRFAESILNDEIIEKEKNFSLIKFSNKEFSNTQQQKENRSEIDVANSASRRRN